MGSRTKFSRCMVLMGSRTNFLVGAADMQSSGRDARSVHL